MNGRDGSVCCLSLLDEKDLEGIVGVGVLLRSERSALGVAAGGYELWSDPSFVLGKSGRALREPKIPLRASVVFVYGYAERGSDVYKAVPVKFRRLRPWRARVLGMEWGQNLLSEFGRFLNGKLEGSDVNCAQEGSSEDINYINMDFEVWCVDEYQQVSQCQSVGSNDGFNSDSEICCILNSCNISLGFSKVCRCGFREIISNIDELHIENLWEIAGLLAHRINYNKENKFIKHFGFLVPESEIKWVKATHYQKNLPELYRTSQKSKSIENTSKI